MYVYYIVEVAEAVATNNAPSMIVKIKEKKRFQQNTWGNHSDNAIQNVFIIVLFVKGKSVERVRKEENMRNMETIVGIKNHWIISQTLHSQKHHPRFQDEKKTNR